MTEENDDAPQTKFTAMSEMSKELLSKGVEATKSSSNLNKLPEEVDKKISKYLGGKKTKKTLKRKTK